MRKAIAILSFLLTGHCYLYAQESFTADSLLQLAERHAVQGYDRQLIKQSDLYTGVQTQGYLPSLEGNPYLDTLSFQKGWLYYQGGLYENVPIQYDLVANKLLILHYNKIFRFEAIDQRLDSFYTNGHRFVHLRGQTSLPDGYYEKLYNGWRTIWLKRQKIINEEVNRDGIRRWVGEEKRRIYVSDTANAVEIGSKRALFRYVGKQKTAVRKHLRRERLRFRKDAASAVVEAIRFFESKNRQQ